MKKEKPTTKSEELALRVKELTDTIAVSYGNLLDMIPFEWGRPGITHSELPFEDLFEIAKYLAPEIEQAEAKAKAIFNTIPRGAAGNVGEAWDLLTGLKYDGYRIGYFTGVLMGAALNGASEEKIERLRWALCRLLLSENLELASKSKPAVKTEKPVTA